MQSYEEDANGFVTFHKVPISRSGIFEYLGSQLPSYLKADPNKIYKVYRPKSALNNPDTIKSFNQIPWLDRHVMIGNNFVPAESANIQGTTGTDTYFDPTDSRLYTSLRLLGSSLKLAIKQGLKQLSCGMRCSYKWARGHSPDGEQYDIVQTGILGNHLASVELGRAGDEFAVAMDSATIELESLTKDKGTENMTIEEMIAKVKEAQPAQDELKKLLAEINAMVGDGEEQPQEPAEEEPESPSVGEDEEQEDMPVEKNPAAAMDAAAIFKIVSNAVSQATKPLNDKIAKLEGSAMDERAIMKSINDRNALGARLSQVVGQFNYQEKTLAEVAKYGVEKLSIACDSGQEVIAVKSFLQGRQKQNVTVDRGIAQDAKDAPQSEALKKMGL
jgi:uncharacterized protein